MSEPQHREQRARRLLMAYPRAVPLAIALLVSAITSLGIFAIESGEAQRERAELRERAQAIASALERRGGATASYLRAGAALFSSVGEVTPALFNRFVSNLRVDSDYRGSDGIGWAQRLEPGGAVAFEAEYLRQTGRMIQVRSLPEPDHKLLLPVTFLRPDNTRNRRALGFDMYSEPVRREAMDRAEREHRPIATGRLVLLQEGTGNDAGFIMFMPVFEDDRSPARLTGFVYSPFNAQEFLASALALESRGEKGIRLYDGMISRNRLLAELPPGQSTGLTVTEPVTVGKRDLILEVESARGNWLSGLSILTLLFGVLVAGLLILVARLLTRQALEDQATLARFEEQASIRNTLTRELNHRVKNTLANVLSIMALTRRRAGSLDEFADRLDGRIRALSATHDLLVRSDWGSTPLRALIEAELAPYARAGDSEFELTGPDVALAPNDALSLGLAIHELATNAAKYGALSREGGKVAMVWRELDESLIEIHWRETGGPQVPAQRGPGFGTSLIEKFVARELRYPVRLSFEPEGVQCVLTVPLRQPREFAIRAGSGAGSGSG